ncbi:hypothetical protein DCAR_0206278 [Daucus carota subsp. sativus]|uniref:Uncharacterized protein n=2 Tax=Daucus carota subsp. sativus TaxID=79200 RepID=A0A161X182_DAUCS|nr:hypothetical protein DCAR_0206278 [Daucus carota subsp. sativus]
MDEQGLKSTSEMTRSLKQKLKKYGLALKKRAIGVGPDPDPSQSNREGTVDLGKDSDTLVFSELSVNVVCDSESEFGESVLNDFDLSAEKIELTEPIDVYVEEKIEFTEPIDVNVEEKLESTEPIDVDVEETEVVDKMMVEENCKWVRLSGNSEKVDQGANSATIFKEPVANPAPASSTNTNFIEIAKKRGLTFDRPRWWPSDEVIARDWKRRLAG